MRGLCYFLLSILTQVRSSTVNVTGLIGHDVTLPCKYNIQTHGVLSFCWGRGQVPRFQCTETILSSKDGAVQVRQSSKYQLLGEAAGDVSLTILNAQQSDAGVYGCRVEVPGWFNDYKVNTHLVMKEAPLEQLVTRDWTVSTEISTSSPESIEVSHSTLTTIKRITSEEKFSAVLGVGNVTRMGAILFFTIIIILYFALRRRFKRRRMLQRLNPTTAENLYEIVPVPE